MKKIKLSPLVWLIAIPIFSFIIIILLANGIRELIVPEMNLTPEQITIITWIELGCIGLLAGISIFCLIILFWLCTKYISVDQLEAAFYEIKNRD